MGMGGGSWRGPNPGGLSEFSPAYQKWYRLRDIIGSGVQNTMVERHLIKMNCATQIIFKAMISLGILNLAMLL